MYIENPDTSNLRYGYTTGACATAATKAALIMMIRGKTVNEGFIVFNISYSGCHKNILSGVSSEFYSFFVALIMMIRGKTVYQVEINLPVKKTARFLIEHQKIEKNRRFQ